MKHPNIFEDLSYTFSKNTLTQMCIFIPTQLFLFCFFYGIFYLDFYDIDATIYFSTIDYVGAFIRSIITPVIYNTTIMSISILSVVHLKNKKKISPKRFFKFCFLIVLLLFFATTYLYPKNDLLNLIFYYFSLFTTSLMTIYVIQPRISREVFLTIFITGIVISLSFITAISHFKKESKNPDYTVSYNHVENHDVKLLANSSSFFIFYDQELDRTFAVPTRSIKSISTFNNTIQRAQFFLQDKKLNADIRKFIVQLEQVENELSSQQKVLESFISTSPNSKSPSQLDLKLINEKKADVLNTLRMMRQNHMQLKSRLDQQTAKSKELKIVYKKKELPTFDFPS